MKVGEFLKNAIFYSGRTQQSIANDCGINPVSFCDIIKGRRNISIDYAKKIEKALGVPAMVLLTWQNCDKLK